MNLLKRIIRTEPILFSRVIASVAALAVAFGVPITDDDTKAAVEVTTMVFAIGNLILARLERETVYSPATHEREVTDAFIEGVEAASPEDGAA